MCVFQWFLISLSVLPCSLAAIFDHLLPSLAWRSMTTCSSASVRRPRLRSGRR
uniref:Uncharacterized protein n=1 Tax=Arundo donax TaxID=35708 RepID=A0A0A9HF62_ARUDO